MADKEQLGKHEAFRDAVLAEAAKGNVVLMTPDGPMVANLDEIIKQPAGGILYDLNRDRATILTFIDDPKWVNDYAAALVIEKLKTLLDAVQRLDT